MKNIAVDVVCLWFAVLKTSAGLRPRMKSALPILSDGNMHQLGLYNGQNVESWSEEDLVAYCRSSPTPDTSFVQAILLRVHMPGAVLTEKQN